MAVLLSPGRKMSDTRLTQTFVTESGTYSEEFIPETDDHSLPEEPMLCLRKRWHGIDPTKTMDLSNYPDLKSRMEDLPNLPFNPYYILYRYQASIYPHENFEGIKLRPLSVSKYFSDGTCVVEIHYEHTFDFIDLHKTCVISLITSLKEPEPWRLEDKSKDAFLFQHAEAKRALDMLLRFMFGVSLVETDGDFSIVPLQGIWNVFTEESLLSHYRETGVKDYEAWALLDKDSPTLVHIIENEGFTDEVEPAHLKYVFFAMNDTMLRFGRASEVARLKLIVNELKPPRISIVMQNYKEYSIHFHFDEHPGLGEVYLVTQGAYSWVVGTDIFRSFEYNEDDETEVPKFLPYKDKLEDFDLEGKPILEKFKALVS